MEKEIVAKEVTIEEVKKKIVAEIKRKYNMTVSEFSRSRYAHKLGIKKNLSAYLSNGSTSFPVLQKLCTHLNLGKLEQKIEVTKSIIYTL